jgi:hypothetical protein
MINDTQELLKQFASAKSQFFELRDGEEKKVRFVSAQKVPNNFDGGKTQCIRFSLQVDGVIQLWDRTSRDLALQMSKITKGSLISIKRSGEKSKTKYVVKEIIE